MIWLLLAFGLYLSPAGLLVCFEAYALGRRLGWQWLEALGVCGLPADWFCARTWMRWLAPEGRTVSARAAAGARAALASLAAGNLPTPAQGIALGLAVYLNARDPGHVTLT